MAQDERRRLEDLLDREIDAARSLAATLAAERTALPGDSPQVVEQMAAEKIQILGTIEKLEAERRALWTEPSLGLAGTGGESWRNLLDLMGGCCYAAGRE